MARVLIVEGADRGLRLATALIGEGHAVRLVTGDAERRGEIERRGAECLLGTPDRLATLRGALEHVTIACWLLADASEDLDLARALHGPRLKQFLCGAIDTTLRGFVYEAGGSLLPPELLAQGKQIVSETAARNSIPAAILTADQRNSDAWLAEARAAIGALLAGGDPHASARYAAAYIPKSRSAFGNQPSIQEDD
jgi:hypothetical protein